MEKEWFIKIDGEKQGPYSIEELKVHPLVTPDTLVRRKSEKQWVPAGKVEELRDVFRDEGIPEDKKEPSIDEYLSVDKSKGVLAVDFHNNNRIYWIIILVLIIIYVLYRMN
ncbi:MAG: DUF4339 domain-containing protein [Waddliaceae bacterium]|jgi:hypothetical protein|nr:DUF4339 domain-containing protein [Waddliaceae bacterium]MBT3579117.1 DUF4339 domain-containing protein [Waddliaceae bacterium]MBT4444910.1 DUF4339 domain-containing protein [Waddliaceae bacterium]MBT6927937.1 DUF4339 domain-containing protein [Waddliaceae bacterium]MBT7264803.1 DUF4339 domain-containing protein [Waddliaceae bacterium]